MRNPGRMFHKVNDIPLKYKFLLIYLFCVLFPIIALNIFFYQRHTADIRIREEDNLRKSIERASGELLGMIEESVALSHSIASDNSIYEALDRTYDTAVDYYEEYNSSLRGKLTRYQSASPNILEIGIYADNPTIQTGTHYHVIGTGSQNTPWLERLMSTDGSISFTAYHDNRIFNPGRRISIVSRMNKFPSYSKYAKYLKIDLNVDKVDRILNRETGSLQLQLVDEQNRVVATSAGFGEPGAQIPAHPSFQAADPESGLVLERPIASLNYVKGWKLVGFADTRRMDALLAAAHRSIYWLAVASTVLPTLLIWIILRSYHYRVKKLSKHMGRVRNECFDLIDIPEGRDEIGALIRNFNVMTCKINSLINEVYKLEIRQKSLELERVRTELSMLQSQMNPHFLFNTLNALLVVCTKKGYTDVAEIMKNLSLLMRQLLTRADDLVPLQEEIQFTAMYLQIEKFRFGELFDYTFDIDPRALALRIPRMSIQPLVENACKHGLQARKDNRKIRVAARLTERALEIQVSDNGVGMEEAKLRRLMEDIRSDRRMDGHIGIRSVYRRLGLFYHDQARFLMESDPDTGTEAGFHIPVSRLDVKVWMKEA
ncbi:putative HAMP domain-containing sensor [Paenibacillus mucilaginosus 3016]|uniref:Putative HAMP domain-containing sensor n=1 Tax=Paenibacillus mucilaginosus 3016 TaxID=1116391 RepID=H6NAW3_9BACL|nr:histidine kinase [Paenibacillus mucilaginosus]AFC30589.1 putative HAMP domain-containing sensor [Paenibacillus mucilaginosus 3016]WFA19211.1 sensor histidine kinase [Paenibacillus mucilaginosus]